MTDLPAARDTPRVLLVDPYIQRDDPMERKFIELYPSMGLLSLASYLRQHGAVVEVTDLTFARDASPVSRALRRFRPHVVGVHTKTLMLPRALEIAARARGSDAFAVAGGPDAATRPERYLGSGFDAVVLGEGEETIVAVAEAVVRDGSVAHIPGVATQESGRLVRGPARPFLRDLDALPLPAWDLIDMEEYLARWQKRSGDRRAAVVTSRGCPFDCAWCSKPTFGRTYRQQSVGRVLRELDALKDTYQVDYIRFCDDVFGINRRWLEGLLDGLVDGHFGLRFECLARVDLLKADLLYKMREAGLERVYVGVESGSQKMLDLMNRGTKLQQVERAAQALRENGIRQFWFLMLGYPGETLDDIDASLRLFRRFSPEEYSVSVAVPVPGTRFYDAVRDRLTGRERARRSGGSLLFEAAYPESLYRWEQARFALEARLGRVSSHFSVEVIRQIQRALDEIHERVAKPLLLGSGELARKPGPREKIATLPMLRPPSARPTEPVSR